MYIYEATATNWKITHAGGNHVIEIADGFLSYTSCNGQDANTFAQVFKVVQSQTTLALTTHH